jgi:hypothetical protein
MSCASSGHITKLEQSIFAPFDIYASIARSYFYLFISGQISPKLHLCLRRLRVPGELGAQLPPGANPIKLFFSVTIATCK